MARWSVTGTSGGLNQLRSVSVVTCETSEWVYDEVRVDVVDFCVC